MFTVKRLAVACGILAAQVEGARISRKRKDRDLLPWDTFHQDDEDGQKRMEIQRMPTNSTIADEDAPPALSTPMAAGSGPRCANGANGQRVVSIADLHGDFEGMVRHMYLLGLLSHVPTQSTSTWSGIWAGGDTIFVQTGDVLSRGPDGRVMYKFLWALQDQAPKGSVVLLTGNHELMVLQGWIRFVTNIDFCAYTSDNCGGSPPSSAAFCSSSGGTCCSPIDGRCDSGGSGCMQGSCEMLQSWDKDGEMGSELRKRFNDGRMKLVYQVNGVVFTHAGLTNSIWERIGTRGSSAIDRLNNLTIDLFNGDARSLWFSSSVIAANDRQNGPMWTRMCYENWFTTPGMIDDDERGRIAGDRCETIAQSLKDVGAERMVIGHCPRGDASIRTSCSGTFIETDTYMSIFFAGTRSVADYNMVALELYSADPKANIWAVYSGQNRCQDLGGPGTVPPEAPPSPGSFAALDWRQQCPPGKDITSAHECWSAAASLGYTHQRVGSWSGILSNCLLESNSGRLEAWFNLHTPSRATSRNRPLCKA